MKPNFMVIGAAKCATTSLCALLGRHPQIFMVAGKEPNFFNDDERYARGLDPYEALFDAAGARPLRGEGSPVYTMGSVWPATAERIAAYAPELRLIYIVRHPLEKIESSWLEMRSWGGEAAHRSFNRALEVNRAWLVEPANYGREIGRYRRFFPDERILVLFFEDFCDDPRAVLRRAFAFLGADPTVEVDPAEGHLRRSADLWVPRPVLSLARSVSWLRRAVRRWVPAAARRRVRERLLTTRPRRRPRWDPAIRRRICAELATDTARFLASCGRPADAWRLQ